MAQTYSFYPGELVVLRKDCISKYWGSSLLHHVIRALWVLLPLLGSGLLTCIIYWKSMPAPVLDGTAVYTLSDSITMGALFATFGSAVIAVFTLSSSQQLNLFYENLAILREDLASDELMRMQWKRWPFLPRMGRLPLLGGARYSALNNASISFHLLDRQEVFPLPTTLADFWELPVLRGFLQMKHHRRTYLQYLTAIGAVNEYPAWDCVSAMYKNILLYRFSCACVWVGTCFVLHSIMFSFLYPTLYPYVAAFCA